MLFTEMTDAQTLHNLEQDLDSDAQQTSTN